MKHCLYSLGVILATAFLWGATSFGQDCFDYSENPTFETVYQSSFTPDGIALWDDVAVCFEETFSESFEFVARIVSYDVSDPAAPRQLYSRVASPGGFCQRDSLVMMASGDYQDPLPGPGFGIYRIEPDGRLEPVVGGYLESSGHLYSAVDFQRSGDILIVLGQRSYYGDAFIFGYRPESATDWEPWDLLNLIHLDHSPIAMETVGSRVYCSTSSATLEWFEFSENGDRTDGGLIPLAQRAGDLEFEDGFLFGACAGGTLLTLDVRDPDDPKATYWSRPAVFEKLRVEGHRAYLLDRNTGPWVVDVSDPYNPVDLTTLTMFGHNIDLAVRGGRMFLANEISGFNEADLYSGSLHPVLSSLPVSAGSLAQGRHTTIATAGTSLKILDFEDPLHPAVFSSVDLGFAPTFLQARNGFAVVGRGYSWLRAEVWDCRDPHSPCFLSTIIPAEDGIIYSLTTFKNWVVAGMGEGVMRIYDLQTPAFPRLVSTFTLPSKAVRWMAAFDRHLVVWMDNELCVVDCSVPNEGIIVGRTGASYANGLYAFGERVYLNCQNKVEIFDISDPMAPTLLGTVPSGGSIYDLAVLDDSLHLATAWGVQIWDIADLDAPVLAGGSLGYGRAIVRSGRNLIVANGIEVLALATPCSALDPKAFLVRQPEGGPGIQAGPPGFSASLWPNPFNPATTITFVLSQSGSVRVKVYDLRGRMVESLLEAQLDPGRHSVEWDGKDQSGQDAPSGEYLFRVEGGSEYRTYKAILLR